MGDDLPSDRAEVLRRCRDAGFTPGARHVEALVELWRGSVKAERKVIAAALARGEEGVAHRLLRDFGASDGTQRAMRLRVVGRIHRRVGLEGFETLALEHLRDPTPAVVREAARAIGKSQTEDPAGSEAALLLALESSAPPEGKAIVEALGRIGGAEARRRLAAGTDGDAELQRVLEEAITLIDRRQGRGDTSRVVGDRPLPRPMDVVLRCRSGVAPVVRQQVQRHLGVEVGPAPSPGSETALNLWWAGSLDALYRVRCALDVCLAFPLPRAPTLAERIVGALRHVELVEALCAWTDGEPRFRLTIGGQGSRRAVVWEVARTLTRCGSPLRNDSRDASWVVEVDEHAGRILCTPRGADPRFAYRRADVPAASHPTLAAMLAWLGDPRPGEWVWDPFCGSGSELIECAKLQPDLRLWGTDVDEAALEAARTNASAAGLTGESSAIWELADARRARPPGDAEISVVLSNPPMGRRVARDGSLRALLEGFIVHLEEVLAPAGRLVWVTPLPEFTRDVGARLGLSVEDLGRFDMGGFEVGIQRMRR